jgi:steroid 5-alpha reductase family enzyme
MVRTISRPLCVIHADRPREFLRKQMHPGLFFLFNVTFISFLQNVLLFFITTPAYIILLVSRVHDTMAMADIIIARVLMVLILIETFADQQQWGEYHLGAQDSDISNIPISDFQNAKKDYQKTAKLPEGYDQDDLDRGFVVTGLWSWCRHPNFAAEQAIWILIYHWGCWATDTLYNWTLVGAMSYIFLFQGSTWFTESLTASKYPEYKEYRQRVARFIPRLHSNLPGDFSDQKAPARQETKAPKGAKGKKGRK